MMVNKVGISKETVFEKKLLHYKKQLIFGRLSFVGGQARLVQFVSSLPFDNKGPNSIPGFTKI